MNLLDELDAMDDEVVGEAIAADADAVTPDHDPTAGDHTKLVEPVERFIERHEL